MPVARVADIDVHYDAYGSGDPIVWVPGTGLRGATWDRQVREFRLTNRCITLDLRGSGDTMGGSSSFTVADLATDVAGLLDALHIVSAHVVGLGLGSAVAQELALARPDLVRTAVLLATWSSTARENHIRRHFESRLYALEHGPLDVFAQFAFWMSAPSVVDDEPELQARVERELKEATSARLDGTAAHFRADLGHETLDRLGGITAPTLVVYGDEDLITLPAYNERVGSVIPNARVQRLAGAGHLAYLERPEELNRRVAEFLRDAS